MKAIRYSLISMALFLVTVIMAFNGYAADDDPLQERAIQLILETADRICVTIETEGSSHVTEFSGEANAELSKVLKSLADLGIKGAAKYQESDYQGVLREDLIDAINAQNDCKLAVFERLEAKLILPRTQDDSDDKDENEMARQAVLDPYNHEWKCEISLDDFEGKNLAIGELQFGKVIKDPKMAYARVKFSSKRTKRLDREFDFDTGQWSLGYFGECLEGECMGFFYNKKPHVPVFLINEVGYDEDNGAIDISGVVMTKKYGKHDRLCLIKGICTPE